MPSCAFGRCNNYSTSTHPSLGITYHSFPKDPLMKETWICIVRAERSECDWEPRTCSKICSEHFKEEHKYISYKGKTLKKNASMLLKKNAVPVITPILKIETKKVPTYVEMKEEDLEDIEASIPIPTYVILKYIHSSVANLSSASCSQTNTACGSPTRESHIEKSTEDVTAITEELGSPLSDISIHSDAADSPEEQEIKNKLKMFNENEELLKRRCEEASILENQHKELLADIKYLQNMFKKKCKSFKLNEL